MMTRKTILGGQPGAELTDSGYEFVTWCGYGEAIFRERATGKDELWFANKYCASYRLHYNGTHFEFARSIKKAVA